MTTITSNIVSLYVHELDGGKNLKLDLSTKHDRNKLKYLLEKQCYKLRKKDIDRYKDFIVNSFTK
ncbi:hypothetical protein DID75_00975 [Candidatus Marinamargulisbacteria bacterium SCGC AG-410-N11]|nr:hypothetical protein DID75_00975 [Candidatus Marinamargulisbacteria bacterium SCGC AG-410-N11]